MSCTYGQIISSSSESAWENHNQVWWHCHLFHFIWNTQLWRGRETKRDPPTVTLQMTVTARAETGWNWETGFHQVFHKDGSDPSNFTIYHCFLGLVSREMAREQDSQDTIQGCWCWTGQLILTWLAPVISFLICGFLPCLQKRHLYLWSHIRVSPHWIKTQSRYFYHWFINEEVESVKTERAYPKSVTMKSVCCDIADSQVLGVQKYLLINE